jgi:hypothetical protein
MGIAGVHSLGITEKNKASSPAEPPLGLQRCMRSRAGGRCGLQARTPEGPS